MINFLIALHTFVADRKHEDKGATAVEYGLMVALIAVAIIVAVTFLSGQLQSLFSQIGSAI